MTENNLDGMVCTFASDILPLSGYWPVMSACVGVLNTDGDCRLLVPEDEEELARATANATLVTYRPGTLDAVLTPVESLRTPLARILQELGLEKSAVGIRMGAAVQPAPYAVSAVLAPALPDLLKEIAPAARLHACDAFLDEQKSLKTRTELKAIARTAKVVAAGFAAVEGAIQPGLREAEVAAAMQHAFDTSPLAEGIERSYGFFFCMSGPNSAKAAAAYARTRQRTIKDGDLVMVHANTCADGYWTDVTRTYTAAKPSQRQQKMREAIDEARAAALAAIRPGVAARDVDGVARRVMAAHGFGDAFQHSTGHGVGFAAANANALPRIHPASPDILEAGMTFNVEPAAYFEGYGGMRHCDMVQVTQDGAKVLTDF